MVKVIPTLPIAFPMANFTYMPNFSLLGLPLGLKQGPVALVPGPGPLLHGEVLVQAHLDHGDNVQGPLGRGIQVQGQLAILFSASVDLASACTPKLRQMYAKPHLPENG